MTILIKCGDCGRQYGKAMWEGEPDPNGKKPMQCPNCDNLIGHKTKGGELQSPPVTGPETPYWGAGNGI